jgi:hypothetical protein
MMDLQEAKRVLAAFEAEGMILDGVRIRVATPKMLYRMKRNTVRAQDRLDAEMIRKEFNLEGDR